MIDYLSKSTTVLDHKESKRLYDELQSFEYIFDDPEAYARRCWAELIRNDEYTDDGDDGEVVSAVWVINDKLHRLDGPAAIMYVEENGDANDIIQAAYAVNDKIIPYNAGKSLTGNVLPPGVSKTMMEL